MGDLAKLYQEMKNPLDNPEVIKKILEVYSDLNPWNGMYNGLVKTQKKEYVGKAAKEDYNHFYSMMFNKWKNSIISISNKRLAELFKEGAYKKDFLKLKSYLETINDVKTAEEAMEIFRKKFDDKELEKAMEAYKWTAFGENTGWQHVASRYVTAKKDKLPNVEHRLYLDTNSPDTYKIISHLVEKCDEHQLPYYFKFDPHSARDDSVVIYSDTKSLIKYIEILREIQQEHPDLVARAKEPPILTGKIDNWIGYGSEPIKTPEGKNQSFNKFREKILSKAIREETNKWILTHKNMKIHHNGADISIQDYIAEKMTDEQIEAMKSNFKSASDKKKMELAKIYGYSPSDLDAPIFRQEISNAISTVLKNNIEKICDGRTTEVKDIKIKLKNTQQRIVEYWRFDKAIRKLAPEIPAFDPKFMKNIKNAIEKEAKQNGIDPKNFCFDTKARDALLVLDKQMDTISRSKKKEEPTNNPQKNNIEVHNKQDDKDKENARKQELIAQIKLAEQKGEELEKKIAEVKSHSPYSHYETKQETYKKKNIRNPEYFQQQVKIENKDNDAKVDKEKKDNEDFTRIIKADIKNNANKITFESTKKEDIINDYIEEEER